MPLSTTSLLRGFAKLTRAVSLLLLPALAAEVQAMSAPQRRLAVRSTAQPLISKRQLPYLAALGAVPLRFARPLVAASTEPPAPPVPKIPEVAPAPAKTPDIPVAPVPEPEPVAPKIETPPAPVEPATKPIAILPDDLRREIRPEDVLPYFHYPRADAANREVHVVVPFTPAQPNAAPQPSSSATYERK